MRRQRCISEFGGAEFLGASRNDAPQSARQSLAALPFEAPKDPEQARRPFPPAVSDDAQILGGGVEDLAAVLGHQHQILYPHAHPARKIDARLH